jgi:hypothetical protein
MPVSNKTNFVLDPAMQTENGSSRACTVGVIAWIDGP